MTSEPVTDSSLSASDGTRWRVRRRWTTRPVPRLKWRGWRPGRRKRDDDVEDPGFFEAGVWFDAADGALAGIAFAVAAMVVVLLLAFVLLPLIGLAFELALLFVLFGSGLFGRVVLRRPWIVEAVCLDDPADTHLFAVSGWRRSRRAIGELKAAIPMTGVPAQLTEAERISALPAPVGSS